MSDPLDLTQPRPFIDLEDAMRIEITGEDGLTPEQANAIAAAIYAGVRRAMEPKPTPRSYSIYFGDGCEATVLADRLQQVNMEELEAFLGERKVGHFKYVTSWCSREIKGWRS